MSMLSLRMKLAKRHIITGAYNTVCHFYSLLEESLNHLFLLCPFSVRFQVEACGWFGAGVLAFSGSLTTFLLGFIDGAWSVTNRKMFWFFGSIICWAILFCKNVIVFKSDILNKMDILDLIKLISWEWFATTNPCGSSCLLDVWSVSSISFFL